MDTDVQVCVSKPEDDECLQCVSENCCAQLIDCYADADCECPVDCITELGIQDLAECQALCDIVGLPAAALKLSSCQAVECPDNGC